MCHTDIFLIYPEIDPNSPWYMAQPLMPPQGLAFLAGILRQDGYQVKILDNSIEKKSLTELSEIVKKESPTLVGISCLSVNYQPSLRIAKHLKQSLAVQIIVGGPHATVFPETFQVPFIDFICIGEGEPTILELCNALRNGGDITAINGLAVNKSGKWITNKRRELIEKLDTIPHPAIDLLPISQYKNSAYEISTYPVLALNTSRGCPFDCTFCSVSSIWQKRYRTFSVNWILEGINELVNTYHAKGIYFYEDNFTLLPKRVEAICDGILQRNYNIKWACEGRIGSLSLHLLNKMKRAGCETIKFGIESGSPRILECIKKGITLEKIRETRKLCKKTKIKFGCFMMQGFPFETDEDRKKTLELVKELQPDYLFVNTYIPTPRSPLYEEILKKQNYEYMDENYFLYLKEFDKEVLKISEENIYATWKNRRNKLFGLIPYRLGILSKAIRRIPKPLKTIIARRMPWIIKFFSKITSSQ